MREMTVCSAKRMWPAQTSGSTLNSGCEAWAPLPAMSMRKRLLDPMNGPARTPRLPTGRSGQLCKAKTASQGKRSNRPSSIMARAPAWPPSSAGWKMQWMVPSNSA
ncbi:hypothetical protein D3C87_1506990 [compost metagenome]